eukprot:1071728-Pleurochrysis_carterae.AAC.1
MIEDALASKPTRTIPPDVLSSYQSLVGALLYCSTQTRPDIAFAMGMLCRAMSCPTPELLEAAKRVLMYLSLHRSVGLRFARSHTTVEGFSDSNWATKHSTSGYVFMYNQATISWASKKQPSVALSVENACAC